MLEKFLHKNHKIVAEHYIPTKIDTSEMKHGRDVAKRLRKSRVGGIPWMVILDADGKELISSDGPKGNCGYPVLPHEVDHFLKMMRTTAKKMNKKQLEVLKRDLEEYRKQREKKRAASAAKK